MSNSLWQTILWSCRVQRPMLPLSVKNCSKLVIFRVLKGLKSLELKLRLQKRETTNDRLHESTQG